MAIKFREYQHAVEKPKNKRRRLRQNLDVLSQRVPRDEERLPRAEDGPPTEEAPTRSPYKEVEGECGTLSCGAEAACIPAQEGRAHYCLCPHDARPPTEDLKCPIRNTVPLKPKPIHNIIPPQAVNASAPPPAQPSVPAQPAQPAQLAPTLSAQDVGWGRSSSDGSERPLEAGGSTGLILVSVFGGGAVILLAVLALTTYYVRRKSCLKSRKTAPRLRPGEPLLAERYITNPQYGVYGMCGAPGPAGSLPRAGEEAVPLIDRSTLIFLEEVGEGCFGKVHKGVLRTGVTEQIVAVKVLKESAGRTAEEDFFREVSIMAAFKHPNILALVGVVHREELGASPWMVFEYMEWGDLAGVLRGARGGRPGPHLDEAALLKVALQVAKGMQYLASKRFVHRDLAARNCLVGTNLTVKIADFGMSRDVYTCDYYKMGGERPMPVRWMSPESIVYARFTLESDVWSYGVLLWEIYSRGKQPFYGHNNDGATKLILQGIVLVAPEECPAFAAEVMRLCWRTDPAQRVTFDEIVRQLEGAAAAVGTGAGATGEPRPPATLQRPPRLPRPPPTPHDSQGYLVPAPPRIEAEYLATIPDPEFVSSSSDEYDEDF